MAEIIELADNCLYRGTQTILKNITWKIKKGEHWALIGPNGSGKTSLLKIVSGNIWPSSGSVKVLGKAFGKTDLRELRKRIGLVSSYLIEQIPDYDNVINIVVSGKYSSFGLYENISKKDKKQAIHLLEFMECANLKDRIFNGLSQGEKQKILIARALASNPLILILDEPCSGLDKSSKNILLKSISKICRKGKTAVIYATHHFDEIVPEIDNMLALKEGRVYKRGKMNHVLNPKNIGKLFD